MRSCAHPDVLQPTVVDLLEPLGQDPDVAVCDRRQGGFCQGLHLHEPLVPNLGNHNGGHTCV